MMLVERIDKFGEEIEADLFDRGWDLLDYFRGRRPFAQLWRLLRRLPPHSRYVAAMLDDPEFAADMAEHDTGELPDLSMEGFDPTRALLSALLDAINQNTAATIAAAGAEPPTFEPAPRPVTRVEKERQRLRHDARKALAALALGMSVDQME